MKKLFAVIFVLAIFLTIVGGDSDSEPTNPPPTESKSVEEPKPVEEPAEIISEPEPDSAANSTDENFTDDKDAVKKYLEDLQPFAVADYFKSDFGIVGPLANGDVGALKKYMIFMAAAADDAKKSDLAVAKEVSTWFACEAIIAGGYVTVKADKNAILEIKNLYEAAENMPEIYAKQEAAEKEIRKVAEWCGADLSNYIETETLRRIVNDIKNF